MRSLLLFAAFAVSSAFAQPALPGTSFRIVDYRVHLHLDIDHRSVRGHTVVRIEETEPLAGRPLAFDAGSLDIQSVRVDGAIVTATRSGNQLLVPAPAHARKQHELDFYYAGSPRFGLEFQPERHEAYTIFSTSQWMVCADDPSVRAPLTISIVAPKTLTVVASGELQSRTTGNDGDATTTFALRDAMPSFLYAFAAGPYRSAMHRKSIRAYSIDRTEPQLRQIAHSVADMLDYMGSRAGRPYRGTFSQLFVGRTIGQEAAGMSLVSEAYGERWLAANEREPASLLLAAHEIAHQWWGARVTNRSWNHFWLNEGFAVFMSATYVEHVYGREAYDAIVQGWRKRVDEIRARGHDHTLVYDEWKSPAADDRAIVYQKGALVLHLLRERLGEEKFWRGVRAYVARFDGRSVETADFRRAMERASRTDLGTFFDAYVDGRQ